MARDADRDSEARRAHDGTLSTNPAQSPARAISAAIVRARSARHLCSAAWVTLGSSVFAFGVGLCFWSGVDFQFQNPYEIVSRITQARYPKQQDALGYAIAILSVAVGATAGWYAWCALAASRFRSGIDLVEPSDLEAALDASLARWARPFATLLVAIVPIISVGWGVLPLVVFPLVAAGLVGGWAFLARPSPAATFEGLAEASESSRSPTWPRLPSLRALRPSILAIVVPLLLYAWLYDGLLIHHRIDMHHEGEILAPWAALQTGAVPFRDIYIQHGLFQNVGKGWLAGELFGVSLASLRATEHLLAPLGHIALYFLGLALFRSWLSAVVLVLVASVANLWSVDRQALGLLAVAALAYASNRGQLARTPRAGSWLSGLWACRMAMLSGVATTLAFFYSSEVGIFTASSCGAFLTIRLLFDGGLRGRQRWLPLAAYLGGAIACFLPFAIAFAKLGALDDLILNTWRQIAYQPTVWGRPFPPLVATLSSVVDARSAFAAIGSKWFEWYLPALIYLFALGHLCLRALRGRLWLRPDHGVLLLVLLTALLQFASSLSRADSFHIKFGTLLMWLYVGLALESWIEQAWHQSQQRDGWAVLRAVARPALACAAASAYLIAVHDPIGKLAARAEAIVSGSYWPRAVRTPWARLGGIRIGDSEFSQLREVVAHIQSNTRPGETIFDFSSQPAYYFLADRPNPTRYALAAYAATPAMQQEVVQDIERHATALVIYQSGGYLDRLDGVPFAQRNAMIEKHLRSNYRKAAQIGGIVILQRKIAEDPTHASPASNSENSNPP